MCSLYRTLPPLNVHFLSLLWLTFCNITPLFLTLMTQGPIHIAVCVHTPKTSCSPPLLHKTIFFISNHHIIR